MSNAAARIVADVGNTRIKWLVCDSRPVKSCSLPPDDPDAWQKQLNEWKLVGPLAWAVSGVHPARRDALLLWIKQRGDTVFLIASSKQLPLKIAVAEPDKVGIDRLLNAVAVNTSRASGIPAFIVDAGSAVTVDYVDEHGVFRGGAIMPGLAMMAKALHEHTALLPLIDVQNLVFELPPTSTVEAMNVGVLFSVLGGIRSVILNTVEQQRITGGYEIHFSGGDADKLAFRLSDQSRLWPWMTLQGVQLCAWPPESQ